MNDKFVNFDPIAEAEKRIGKPYQEFTNDEAMYSLGMAMNYNAMKADMYKTRKDNWFNAPLEVTTGILVDFGFETVLIADGCGQRMSDKLFVMHWQKKILARFSTYMGGLNGGDITTLALMDKPDWNAVPDRFSGGWEEKDKGMVVSYDIREGLKGTLEQLSELNLKPFPWKRKQLLHLLAPGEKELSGNWQNNPNHLDDYGKISDMASEKRIPIIAKGMGLEKLFEEGR